MPKRRRASRGVSPAPSPAALPPPAGRRGSRAWLWLGSAAALVLAGIALTSHLLRPEVRPVSPAAGREASFVGSAACAGCHAKEALAWRGSQHARAMQAANPQTVEGDFDGAAFVRGDVTTTFAKRGDRFFVRTGGPDGKPAEYEVRYTFGLEPLQQYLVELPNGRLQALTIAWDTTNRRWFDLYPGQSIAPGDALHWTGRQHNWNFMCADCHSIDVRKRYDPATGAFATTWAEIHVGCEACHGPGSAHVAWARTDRRGGDNGLTAALDERRGVAWPIDTASGNAARSRPRDTEREIEVCAQCHARRAQIAEGYVAGRRWLDHYVPALLEAPLYHVDGQQRDEVYTWGSFLESRMYRAGVTCSDCHDPHTQKLRAAGNALCAQCHAPAKYDAPSHHFHSAGSPGAECVGCHMPATTYMVVDPRHDHSLRVPRPDLSAAHGVPNACNGCHGERDARWAAATVRAWLGRDARGLQDFAGTFADAEARKPRAAASLAAVAGDRAQPAIVRASALARLAGSGEAATLAAARAAAGDANPLLRLAAARVAYGFPPRESASIAAPLLSDPVRSVRIEAAHALAGAPAGLLTTDQRAALARAGDEYVSAQRYNADRPEARVNLGTYFARLGRIDDARGEFAAARELDPRYVPAYVNEADTLRAQGREDDAMRVLTEGLARVPDDAALHHALGLAQARRKDQEAALKSLARAAQLAPGNARYAYVYAVALNSYGQPREAIRLLEGFAGERPPDHDTLLALASMQRDAGLRDAARKTAAELVAAFPESRDARQLADALKQ
jgi:predicted CXXCH cytochrome family protein